MDNNILSLDYGLDQLKKIGDIGISVDFNQGLDARLVTEDIAQLLARIRWTGSIRFGCDNAAQIPYIEQAYRLLKKYGYNRRIFGYCLIKDPEESIARVLYMRRYDWFDPFCQPYRDWSNPNQIIPQWQKDFTRWVDMKAIYKSVELKDYQPRKGFYFRDYGFNIQG